MAADHGGRPEDGRGGARRKGPGAGGLVLQGEGVGVRLREDPERRQSPLDLPRPAGSPSLWDEKTEGLGERGLCSPTTPGSRHPWQEKRVSHLFHKSRLLTREDQIVAVK